MTNQCVLGPITTDRPVKFDGNEFPDDDSHKFTTGNIANWEAKAIQGLTTPGKRENYNEKHTLSMSNKGWGVIYADTSNGVIIDNFKHKGWGILRKTDVEMVNSFKSKVDCEFDLISNDDSQVITMDYTTLRTFPSNYDTLTPVYALNDAFSSFDNVTNWYDSIEYALNAGASSVTASSGDLLIASTATALNTYGHNYFQSRATYSAPSIFEFDLKKVTTPAAGRPETNFMFFISPDRQTGDFIWKNMVFVMMRVTNTTIKYEVGIINSSGTIAYIVPKTTTTATTHTWKVETEIINNKGYLTVSLDEGSGYNVKWTGDTSIVSFNDLYAGYCHNNADTTEQQFKSGFCKVYTMEETTYNNVVALPEGCTPLTTATFNRASSYGNIPCYVNPITDLQFICTPANFYDGSVKVYSTNNATSTSRQVTNVNEILSPTKFNMDNGIVKVETTANSFKVYYWDTVPNPDAWTLLNEFGVGTINSIKLTQINDNTAKLQINSPKEIIITLKRGKRTINVEHPNTALTYTIKDTYDHDSTTTSGPAANADITMLTQDYCNVYNSTDTIRMQINQLNTATIKSDSIPASSFTGIGVYSNSETSESYDYYSNIANEWRNQTLQRVIIV